MTIYIGDKDYLDVAGFVQVPMAPTIIDRNGEKRLLPLAVIRNALQTWESYKQAVEIGTASDIPLRVQRISWDSCIVLPEGRSVVEVACHPTLDLGEE